MSDEPLQGDKWSLDKLDLSALKEAYATAYPNPDRIGCPGTPVLQDVARGRIDPGPQDPLLHHLTHCSPCFRELLTYRDQLRAERTSRKRRTTWRLTAAIAAVLMVAIALWYQQLGSRSGGSTPDGSRLVADLRDRSPLRGEVGPMGEPESPLRWTRSKGTLLMYLPRGSDDGLYELQLRRATDNDRLLRSWSGTAQITQGITVLETEVDIRDLEEGNYVLAVRQPGRSWREFELQIR